jgi:hypothetical protein
MERNATFDLWMRDVLKKYPRSNPIRLLAERFFWLKLNSKYKVVVFYNTGKHLFIQEDVLAFDSFIYSSGIWKWVEYRRFCKGILLFMKRKNNGGRKGYILFKHHGHNYKGAVGLSFSNEPDKIPVVPQMLLKKHHLYFVSFKKGIRWRTLAQHQHQPSEMFDIYAHKLEIIMI